MKKLLQKLVAVVALFTTLSMSGQAPVITDNNVILSPKTVPEVGAYFIDIYQYNGGNYIIRNIGGFDTTSFWMDCFKSNIASVNSNTRLLGVNSGGYISPFDITILSAYTNTVAVSGGAGNAVFYLTSDKTATGAAIYPNGIIFPTPIVNDATTNYTYGWSYNSATKALTVNVKSNPGLVVGLLTLLGLPANVANGTVVRLTCFGN